MKALELLPPSETMYRALVDRDSSFEGIFFAGVRTTGIFCRPTCTAKKPARENVDFFATPSEALHGGYRPCLRCHPMDPDKRPPQLIERLRAEVERAPGGRLTDKELAAMAIDPSTARRQFKRHYGMTFQAYHRARRLGLALSEVRRGGRVDQAQNGSGFESAVLRDCRSEIAPGNLLGRWAEQIPQNVRTRTTRVFIAAETNIVSLRTIVNGMVNKKRLPERLRCDRFAYIK